MGRYDLTEPKSSPIKLIVAIIVVVGLVAGAWMYLEKPKEKASEGDSVVTELPLPGAEEAEPEAAPEEDAKPSGDEESADESQSSTEEPEEPLPSLEDSDELVRQEVTALSPDFAELVKESGLIEKYLRIINDFSQALRIYKHLHFLPPPAPFVAGQDEQGWHISEKSYRRYDLLAKAFAATDASAAVSAFRKLRPLLQQAYREFGYPEQYRLEDLLKKAASEMIAAPVVEGRIDLVKPKVFYQFADNKLESLSPVQKQMLRMGPDNTRIIQKKLRELVQEMVKAQGE